jgi:hypothetical protein
MNELKAIYNDITSIFVEIGEFGYSKIKRVEVKGSKSTMKIEYVAKEIDKNKYQWTINFFIDNKDDWKHFWSADMYSTDRGGRTMPFSLFLYEMKYPMHQCLMSIPYTTYRFDGKIDKWTKKEVALWKEVFGISDVDWQWFVDCVAQHKDIR